MESISIKKQELDKIKQQATLFYTPETELYTFSNAKVILSLIKKLHKAWYKERWSTILDPDFYYLKDPIHYALGDYNYRTLQQILKTYPSEVLKFEFYSSVESAPTIESIFLTIYLDLHIVLNSKRTMSLELNGLIRDNRLLEITSLR